MSDRTDSLPQKYGRSVRREVAEGHTDSKEYRAVVLLSGGLDSTAALAKACEENEIVCPLNFTYGNLADDVEQAQAERLCDWANENSDAFVCSIKTPDLRTPLEGLIDSPLTASGEDPDNYDDALGYVPFRNVMFLSVAGAYATNNGYGSVYIGASFEDMQQDEPIGAPYAPFWDDLLSETQDVFDMATLKGDVDIVAPLIRDEMTYSDEVQYLDGKDWPLELTYSCFKVGNPVDPVACGECSTCRDRIEAFEEAGVEDPLLE